MPYLLAHRGQRHTYPENTIESITAAICCGAKAVEFDVQMTADNVPVICHDVTLKRTAGVDISITNVSYDAIRDISVGEAEKFADHYHSAKLPALDDMVRLLQAWPGVQAFVELKNESIDAFGMAAFVTEVRRRIEKIQHRCVVIADNLQALLYYRQQADTETGWIVHRWHEEDRLQAAQNNIDYLIINHKYYHAEYNHDFSADSWQWVMYEINDAEIVRSLFASGINLVETGDICSLTRQLAEAG